MAKGIARLGILFTPFLIIKSAAAISLSELPASNARVCEDAIHDPGKMQIMLHNFSTEKITLPEMPVGDEDRAYDRIDSDLLILPGYFLRYAQTGNSGIYANTRCQPNAVDVGSSSRDRL